jgi:hypothetical protein
MKPIADQLEPRARIHIVVTTSLAFRCLCGIAQAPRFWLGLACGSWMGVASVLLGALL